MPGDRPARNGKRDCVCEASLRKRRTFLIDTKLCWINIELADGGTRAGSARVSAQGAIAQ
jgi:hypothetical protein